MQEENKLDTANLFFTDNYSIFDSSSEFFQLYKNEYDNKETQKIIFIVCLMKKIYLQITKNKI